MQALINVSPFILESAIAVDADGAAYIGIDLMPNCFVNDDVYMKKGFTSSTDTSGEVNGK